MNRLLHGAWLAMIVAAFAAAGCSSGSKPANVNPAGHSGTPNTTVPAGRSTTVPGSGASPTTQCTIPQNNGGDHDADNNGGPNDGDGCDV